MKHSIVLKFIAVLLAACALTVALGGAFGVFLLAEAGLYAEDYRAWEEQFYEIRSQGLGSAMAESYAARSLSNLTQDELLYINWGNTPQTIGNWWDMPEDSWCYQIENGRGIVQESNYTAAFANAKCYTLKLSVNYPMKVSSYTEWDESVAYYGPGDADVKMLYIRYVQGPEYQVKVWLVPGSIEKFSGVRLDVYEWLHQFCYYFVGAFAGGLLLAAVLLVYLFCAAGKCCSGDAPEPGGLNRMPLDIYGGITFLGGLGAGLLTLEIVEEFLFRSNNVNVGWFVLAVALVFAAVLCVVGFLMALAAQWKMRGFYIWKHSAIGWCCGKIWKGLRFLGRLLHRVYMLLPLVWRYLLIAFALGFVPLWFFYLAAVGESYWVGFFFLACLCDLVIICYGAYAYGTVLKGAQKMASGELYHKIETRYLLGAHKVCAENLNALADVAVVAARNQIKSEKMKTELITNVSHDIKTPLTSIINYIDLLQKAETPEQSAQYLQVLERQSQRMKKLIEDLVEMSKATTGNLSVELTRVNAVEAVNQALGEFADKLAAKELSVVFQTPETEIPVLADGRLTWRVLSNLLSNVVKYALPGTRVYVELQQYGGTVQIALKNISRESLNMSAQDLTERFVRGDQSRNTEGSGLGLNIAKSLMELQKGQLQLFVDGDLFKVMLFFPAAQ